MPEHDKLLTTPEAVRYTRIRRATILRAVQSGELHALHPNARVYLFDRHDLDEWLESIRKGA